MPVPEFRRQKTSRRFQHALAHGYNGDNRRIPQFANQIDVLVGARMNNADRGPISRDEWLHIFYEMIRDQNLGTNSETRLPGKLFERAALGGPA